LRPFVCLFVRLLEYHELIFLIFLGGDGDETRGSQLDIGVGTEGFEKIIIMYWDMYMYCGRAGHKGNTCGINADISSGNTIGKLHVSLGGGLHSLNALLSFS